MTNQDAIDYLKKQIESQEYELAHNLKQLARYQGISDECELMLEILKAKLKDLGEDAFK